MTTIFPTVTFSTNTINNTTIIVPTVTFSTNTINGINHDTDTSNVGLIIGCIFSAVILIIIPCVFLVKKRCYSSKARPLSSRPTRSSNYIVANPQLVQPSPIVRPPGIKIINANETVCNRLICFEFLQKLNLHDAYFEHKYDRCYCSRCYSINKPKIYNIGGYVYTIPCGRMRIGLKCSIPHDENDDIFRSWATSYYGTSKDQLEKILRNRFVPFPGDKLMNNEIFSPSFHDPNHCYTSPSIYYTNGLKVCEKSFFRSQTNETYQVQLVLQCKQKPNTFEATHGQHGLCKFIPNDRIKWKTSARSTILPYGLIIYMVKQ